ncbi:hypothetical protein SUGI_0116920 [Cryptomeria japonica]|uniref:probable leucine-rich repeat receptor-like protein kinase At5g63930 n=1 Tax=Cryptomeria japonica TaxID=3369 RepID=UPI0024089E4D|nr:probable leucine-rich repeat receptor-like protein kinase At5g63930 [Cryptomeria japonica]GLJ09846.1 hypothetical protein SUGI_0116920 [Cryptomeria japonica]
MACFAVYLALISVVAVSIKATAIPRDAESLVALKQSFAAFPLDDWLQGNLSNFCNWTGVTCDHSNQNVIALNLQNKAIFGSFPVNIPTFSRLTTLNLSSNFITGQIPSSAFASCSALAFLDLNRNNLTGTLPLSLSNCTALKILDLSVNKLTGPVPYSLSKLSKLEQLNFRDNNFTGLIPDSLSNCTNLVSLDLCFNLFINGTIPKGLGLLTRLQNLGLTGNSLSGLLSATVISNLTQLRILKVGQSNMTGPIPSWLGQMPFLEQIWMGSSLYEGNIPSSLGNISSLSLLALYDSSLSGNIPKSLGQLSRLTQLSISYNYLTGSLPAELGNLTILQLARMRGNSLSGSIPIQFGRFKFLQRFQAEYNNFSGRIPTELSNCSALGLLKLNGNQLSGSIPPQLGRLRLLAELNLEQNQLSGTIPESLSNCTDLQGLSLGYNLLHGNIPPAVASLRNIVLSFSMPRNLLAGKIPAEIGGMKFVTVIDLAGNHLGGEIPTSLGNCVELLQLNLSNNRFSGQIPQTLGTLITLTNLDLSLNNLSGPIPSYLGDMATLLFLNLSYNHLSGPIPNRGVFRNRSASSFIGNSDLCSLECPKPSAQSSSGLSKLSKFLIILGSFAFGAVVLTAMVYLYVHRRKESASDTNYRYPGQKDLALVKLNHNELFHATTGFNHKNIIGSGRMATVYSGKLNLSGSEQDVAVKRFKEEIDGSVAVSESLIAEIRALATTRHRNLIRLLGYCLASKSIALVMEMMPNGTLASHIQEKTLTWSICLRIARGVAQGLKYLHYECPQPILHCDLKPSNILLDMDLEPGIADFGISRILKHDDLSRGFSTSNLQGSIGYMPPEYALSGRMTAKGDVYSYGIVILEMVSGHNPTSEMFSEENPLPKWALGTSVNGTTFQVIAPHLHKLEDEAEDREQEMINMVHLGLACTSPRPENRPTMNEVVRILDRISDANTTTTLPSIMKLIESAH